MSTYSQALKQIRKLRETAERWNNPQAIYVADEALKAVAQLKTADLNLKAHASREDYEPEDEGRETP